MIMYIESPAKAEGGIKSIEQKDQATLWRMDWGGKEAELSTLVRR